MDVYKVLLEPLNFLNTQHNRVKPSSTELNSCHFLCHEYSTKQGFLTGLLSTLATLAKRKQPHTKKVESRKGKESQLATSILLHKAK